MNCLAARSRLLLALASLSLLGAHVPQEAWALPLGRAWATAEALSYPRMRAFSANGRLDVNADGIPILLAGTVWDTAAVGDWTIFTWRDSAWRDPVSGNVRSFFYTQPVHSLTPRRYLLWMNDDVSGSGYAFLMIADVFDDRVSVPDTALVTSDQSYEFGGAASAGRRWVARSEQIDVWVPKAKIRTVYSDTFRVWHEVPVQGIDDFHCSIAPLGDTTAILAYAGESGLRWSILDGRLWTQSGVLDSRPLDAHFPRFRFRPSGGLWLLWTERPWAHVSSFRDGRWDRGDSLICAAPPGETFIRAWCDASRDTAERPTLAWSDLGYGFTYRDRVCVSVPTDSGWTTGEEVPGSEGVYISPSVTRDLNGDVWVSWGRFQSGYRYNHTYVRATADSIWLGSSGDRPLVQWRLSDPAPGSRWSVLRARAGGAFEPVARVAAGPGLELSWTDSAPPGGAVLHYRVRRECVDVRYQWLSPEVIWWPRGPALAATRLGANPTDGRFQLEVIGADAGTLEARLYDLQGRLKAIRRLTAAGTGRDVLSLDFTAGDRLRAGVYFLCVVGADGRRSSALRVVLLP